MRTHSLNKKSIPITVVAIACGLSAGAFGQDKADGEWRGIGGASLATTSGNTSTTNVLLNADMARATAADKISLGAMVNYARGKNAGVSQTTADKWAAQGEYDYNLSPQLFVFGKLGLEADKIIDLSLRTSMAGGVGYKLIETKELAFTVFGGLGYTTDKYSVNQTVGGDTGRKFSRTSLYVGEESSHQVAPNVAFKQRLDLYPGLTGDKAFLARFNAGLSVAMSTTLNLTVAVVDTYNSRPPVGLKRNDLGIFTGVNVKFGAL